MCFDFFGWRALGAGVGATLLFAACGGDSGGGGASVGGTSNGGTGNDSAGQSSTNGGRSSGGTGGSRAGSSSTEEGGAPNGNEAGTGAGQSGGSSGRAGGGPGEGGGLGEAGAGNDGGTSGAGGNAGSGGSAGTGGSSGPSGCDRIVAPRVGGGRLQSLAHAENQDLHVIYTDGTDGHVRHAWRSGESWHNELVYEVDGSSVLSLDMKIDGAGSVHIAFVETRGSMPTVRYMKRSEDGWGAPSIVREVMFDSLTYVALGIEADESPYVVHVIRELGQTTRQVLISRPAGSGWASTSVYSSTQLTDLPELYTLTDAQHRPWIGVAGQFLVPTSSGYELQTSTSTRGHEFPQFVIDAAGTTIYAGRLRSVTFGLGAFWTNEDLGVRIPNDRQPLVALSDSGQPLAAFSDLSGDTLLTFVYRRESSGWVEAARYTLSEDVFDSGSLESEMVQERSLQPVALDPEGHPTLVRLTDDTTDLTLLELRPDEVIVSEIDVRPAVRTERGVVTDAEGRLVVAHWEDKGVRITRETEDGTFEDWGPRLDLGAGVESLRLDSEGRPTLPVRDGQQIGVARLVGDAWDFEWLGDAPASFTNVTSLALALADDDTPHVIFSATSISSSNVWSLSPGDEAPVLVASSAGGPVRAFVDGEGTLYAVYMGATARWNGTAWQVAAISGAPYLDADGNLCLVRRQSVDLVSTCFEGGSPVTKEPYETSVSDVRTATLAEDGTLYIVASRGEAGSALLVVAPDGSEAFHTLSERDVTVALPSGAPQLVYHDSRQRRLYTRCLP